jgi:hypothetical protein
VTNSWWKSGRRRGEVEVEVTDAVEVEVEGSELFEDEGEVGVDVAEVEEIEVLGADEVPEDVAGAID